MLVRAESSVGRASHTSVDGEGHESQVRFPARDVAPGGAHALRIRYLKCWIASFGLVTRTHPRISVDHHKRLKGGWHVGLSLRERFYHTPFSSPEAKFDFKQEMWLPGALTPFASGA